MPSPMCFRHLIDQRETRSIFLINLRCKLNHERLPKIIPFFVLCLCHRWRYRTYFILTKKLRLSSECLSTKLSGTTKTPQLRVELNDGTWKERCYLRDEVLGVKQNSFDKKSSAILSLILCTQSAQFRGERLHNTSEGRGGISFCAIRFEVGLRFAHTETKQLKSQNIFYTCDSKIVKNAEDIMLVMSPMFAFAFAYVQCALIIIFREVCHHSMQMLYCICPKPLLAM